MILHCFLGFRLTHNHLMKVIRSHQFLNVFCRASQLNERNYTFKSVEYHALENELIFEYINEAEPDRITGVLFYRRKNANAISTKNTLDIKRAVSDERLLKGFRHISWKLVHLIQTGQIASVLKIIKHTAPGASYLVCKCGTILERRYRPADLADKELSIAKDYQNVRDAGKILAIARRKQLAKQDAMEDIIRFGFY